MKFSILDPHAGWVIERLRAGSTQGEIRDGLRARGCEVALATVQKWVATRRKSGAITVTSLKRGRPKKTSRCLKSFLPIEKPLDPRLIPVPHFFYALLQKLPPETLKLINPVALEELGIGGFNSEVISNWAKKIGSERIQQLSDLELCLLAYLRGSLPQPPSSCVGYAEIDAWVQELLARALQLRSDLRVAVGLVPNS